MKINTKVGPGPRIEFSIGIIVAILFSILITNFIITIHILKTKKIDTAIIDLAERQSMIIQKYSRDFLYSLKTSEMEEVQKNIEQFEGNHNTLINGGKIVVNREENPPVQSVKSVESLEVPKPTDNGIILGLKDVKEKWENLKMLAVSLIGEDSKDTIQKYKNFIAASSEMSNKMNYVVSLYQDQSEKNLKQIKFNQMVMMAAIFTLLITILFLIHFGLISSIKKIITWTQKIKSDIVSGVVNDVSGVSGVSGISDSKINTEEIVSDLVPLANGINEIVEATHVMQLISQEIQNISTNVTAGNLKNRVNISQFDGNWTKIIQEINSIVDEISRPIEDATIVLGAVATNDFTHRMKGTYRGDYAIFQKALNSALDKINVILNEVKIVTEEVANDASKMERAGKILLDGVRIQINFLDQISASIKDIGERNKLNAERAANVKSESEINQDSASKCSAQLNTIISAMGSIDHSGQEIGKVIQVIDEMAFQTNLLALSAALETARAGKYGQGFAVVAEEVINLAQHSSTAAEETTSLIESTQQNVNNGISIVNTTAKYLNEIVVSISKVRGIIKEIATATGEQTRGNEQIVDALNKVSNVTQQNNESSTETAYTATQIYAKAQQLNEVIKKCKLMQQAGAN
ncbi:MAG: hypothetical protein HQK53_13030 [Oligoflexia bacterium]|nr:hypothetical protein [Oligoflexia bacterium]